MGGELQVENYSGWLQKNNGGGLPRKTIVMSFIWRTTAISYRPRTALVGFKWSTLVAVSGERKWRGSDGELQQWAIDGEQQWWASKRER